MITLKEFIKKYLGKKGVGNTNGNKGECVGLASVWMDNIGIEHVWGDAKDIYTNASLFDFKKIKNSSDVYPISGDIICWDSSMGYGSGHIAIVVSSSKFADTFTVFEQNNWTGDNDPSCELTTYTKWTGVIGWLRSLKLEGSDVPSNETELQETVSLLKENIVSLESNLASSETNLQKALIKANEWEKKYGELDKKYAQEVKDLAEQVSKCQEILNDKDITIGDLNEEIIELQNSGGISLDSVTRLQALYYFITGRWF
jgi:hypothetical protein